MRGFIIFLAIFLIGTNCAFGQRQKEEPPPFRERLFYGGNFGLQFGTVTDIQVSPVIGLWLLPRLNVAIGLDYRYYKAKYLNIKTNIYGVKAYSEFILLRNINSVIPIGANTSLIMHLEDEYLSLESVYFDPMGTSGRFFTNTVLAGGGLSQAIGKRASMNFLFLWTLDGHDYGIYGNPEIRISFTF